MQESDDTRDVKAVNTNAVYPPSEVQHTLSRPFTSGMRRQPLPRRRIWNFDGGDGRGRIVIRRPVGLIAASLPDSVHWLNWSLLVSMSKTTRIAVDVAGPSHVDVMVFSVNPSSQTIWQILFWEFLFTNNSGSQ